MSAFLLDTNVLSEIWKPNPDKAVLSWIASAEWFLPVPVIAEIVEGAEAAPSAARRLEVNSNLELFLGNYPDTVLDWDADTARTWGRLKHSAEVKRRPQPLWDSLLDAMAVRHQVLIATRNRTDFRHAVTFDPWTGLEHSPGKLST